MIAAAHIAPAKRKATRPSRAAKAERVDEKSQRSASQAGARKGGFRLMYDFKIDAADKATLYKDLALALEGLVAGEPDPVANMANAAALIWETLPDLNWAGFYRNVGGELVVGPFQGRPACIRIAFGEGVCGAAAATRQVQRVEDVNAFDGHIACDSASASEIVVPLVRDGELIGVLDLDSPKTGAIHRRGRGRLRKLAEFAVKVSSRRRPGPVRFEIAPGPRPSPGNNLANCSSRSSLSEPGISITGHGSLPASLPQKLATSGPGLPLGAAPSTSAAISGRSAT